MGEAIAQRKILRVFQLLNLLSTGAYSTTILAKRLQVNTRTVSRYLDLIEEIGFEVVSIQRIVTEHKMFKLGRKRPAFMPNNEGALSQILFIVQQLGYSVTIGRWGYKFIFVSIDGLRVKIDVNLFTDDLPRWLTYIVNHLQSKKGKEVAHA